MNSTKQIIEQWESDFIQTGDTTLIPEEDKPRVLHEIDVLYEELTTLLRVKESSSI